MCALQVDSFTNYWNNGTKFSHVTAYRNSAIRSVTKSKNSVQYDELLSLFLSSVLVY